VQTRRPDLARRGRLPEAMSTPPRAWAGGTRKDGARREAKNQNAERRREGQTHMASAPQWLAHSEAESGHQDPLAEHLADVARRAKEYAEVFSAAEAAWAAGLLHDLGKYGDLFQKRLRGEVRAVDHWSAGAVVAIERWMPVERRKGARAAVAMAIWGHHLGLQGLYDLETLLREWQERRQVPGAPCFSETDEEVLLRRFKEDGLSLPESLPEAACPDFSKQAAGMLDVRMLFSALVDADYVETEAHFRSRSPQAKDHRPAGPALDAPRALEAVEAYIGEVARRSGAAPEIKQLRNDLLKACLEAAEQPPGLFTLTAPTGAGKTLAMLAFALKHAARHGLRRVVCVLPYLTIIEQTVQVYRAALQSVPGFKPELYVLEDHSLAGTGVKGEQKAGSKDDTEDESRLLAENWDAPVIVTTSVQFLESLFANRPGPCRKLHRLARSVVLFDEVQTLPTRLAVPTLATLSHLAAKYGATIVFSTATQPAFEHLHNAVLKYAPQGWQPREIVPRELNLFARAKRTRFHWPDEQDGQISWEELAERLAAIPQVLCIVNLKRHALALFERLHGSRGEGLYHLSTSMCPAHRADVLGEVRERLSQGLPCVVVSTQCVEAGVDVDFPVVYRAWAPLDSLAQAAGRCNREGKLPTGDVYFFQPAPDGHCMFPDQSYKQAADVALVVLRRYRCGTLDLYEPESFNLYYRHLYDVRGLGEPDPAHDCLYNAIDGYRFQDVARHYQVIKQQTINVVVPYRRQKFDALAEQVRGQGLTRDWILEARPYTIGLYRPSSGPIWALLEPVPVGRRRQPSEEWFLYLGDEYNERTGLTPKKAFELIIA
jgi:CRISPR-associated endonuclease/helicase Cas3